MSTVLMISQNKFPAGDAGALRDECFAQMYTDLGYTVYLICRSDSCLVRKYKGVYYFSLNRNQPKFFRIIGMIFFTWNLKRVIKQIEEENGNLEVFHVYDAPLKTIKYLKRYAKDKFINLVYDSVEWYSPCEFPKGEKDRAYKLKNTINTQIIDCQFKVIAISSYLEGYYKSRRIRTIRIPVITDTDNGNDSNIRNRKINIVYAGSPARKDFIKEILSAFVQIYPRIEKRICLHIIGVSKEEIQTSMCSYENLCRCRESMIVYGRMPHEKVLEMLKDMDFSILVRDSDERYAKAGFPTKSVEAMNNSVAMICNISSDLADYLIDGYNAIIINGDSQEEIEKALIRVSQLDRNTVLKLRKNARETAINNFDYKKYEHALAKLLAEK